MKEAALKVDCPVQNKGNTSEIYNHLQCEGSTNEGSNCPVKDNVKEALLKTVTVQYSVKEALLKAVAVQYSVKEALLKAITI